jgi:hypothetical protein
LQVQYSRWNPSNVSGGSAHMPQKLFAISGRRWLEYIAAILIGNAIFYFSLTPHLPEALRHHGMKTDIGSAIDLAVCAAAYGLIWIGSRL